MASVLSSQGRYNHFDTAAYAYSVSATHAVRIIITKAQVKIKCKFALLPSRLGLCEPYVNSI